MNESTIKILVCGDYYPYSEIAGFVKDRDDDDCSSLFGNLLPLLDDSDLSAINIEFPLTNLEKPKTKRKLYKGEPATIEPIVQAGFSLVCLSNNHILDYGQQGMRDTMTLVKNKGMDVVGCGRNLSEARKPYMISRDGIQVAILNISEKEFNFATQTKGGANPIDCKDNIDDIKCAKKECHHVVVIVHTGQDYCFLPTPSMKKRLRSFVDAGASAVLCHHSHYISGIEEYKGAPIYYGLGSLIYPRFHNEEMNKTIVVSLEVKKHSLVHEAHYYVFDKQSFSLKSANSETDKRIQKQVDGLSFILLNDDLHHQKWLQELKRNHDYYRYAWLLLGYSNASFRVLKKLKLTIIMRYILKIKKSKIKTILNLIRRETHNDASVAVLEELVGCNEND